MFDVIASFMDLLPGALLPENGITVKQRRFACQPQDSSTNKKPLFNVNRPVYQ